MSLKRILCAGLLLLFLAQRTSAWGDDDEYEEEYEEEGAALNWMQMLGLQEIPEEQEPNEWYEDPLIAGAMATGVLALLGGGIFFALQPGGKGSGPSKDAEDEDSDDEYTDDDSTETNPDTESDPDRVGAGSRRRASRRKSDRLNAVAKKKKKEADAKKKAAARKALKNKGKSGKGSSGRRTSGRRTSGKRTQGKTGSLSNRRKADYTTGGRAQGTNAGFKQSTRPKKSGGCCGGNQPSRRVPDRSSRPARGKAATTKTKGFPAYGSSRYY